jgi:hypothetical protein
MSRNPNTSKDRTTRTISSTLRAGTCKLTLKTSPEKMELEMLLVKHSSACIVLPHYLAIQQVEKYFITGTDWDVWQEKYEH